MTVDFTNDFADFLEERLSKALFSLREGNEDYRKLSDELEALLNEQHDSVSEYRMAISKITDIIKQLSSIEKHHLFLAGMRERMKMEEALFSKTFESLFTETE